MESRSGERQKKPTEKEKEKKKKKKRKEKKKDVIGGFLWQILLLHLCVQCLLFDARRVLCVFSVSTKTFFFSSQQKKKKKIFF